ncbi:MAG: CorA family divalent cation transporter [bacterium]
MKYQLKDLVFFLGGMDAEMAEIRDILLSNNCKVVDNHALWGISISQIKDQIENLPEGNIPVLIEITDNTGEYSDEKSKDYIIIDHHNKRAGKSKATSLEQIFDLLEIKRENMSRKQKLISANDRGHIRAMQRLCATDEEIKEIREMDLKYQNITEKDRKLAEEALDKNLELIDDVSVYIKSDTSKISLITDKIWNDYRHIFIEYPVMDKDGNEIKAISYTGTGQTIYKLVKKFDDNEIKWYGGELPEYGYFGTHGEIDLEEVKKMCAEDKKRDKYFSHHIFMFPFVMDEKTDLEDKKEKASNDKNKSDSKDNNNSFLDRVKSNFQSDLWDLEPFCISGDKDDDDIIYNEFVYFYKHVRNSVFYNEKNNKSDNNKNNENDSDNKVLYYKRKNIDEKSTYNINIKGKESYELKISSIHLHIFESCVGILSIDLENWEYESPDDILKINDFGRRIYPQYVGKVNDKGDYGGTNATKGSFLADSINVDLKGEPRYCENFKTELFVCDSIQDEFKIGRHITGILGKAFTDHFKFEPVIDDRMYTLCWYSNECISNKLKKFCNNKYAYVDSDFWYKYIFIDGSPGIANRKMQSELAEKSTYDRWVDWGTLYGISRYSMVSIVNESDFAYNVLRVHMRTMYYQMAVILLMQRASIISFSSRVSKISGQIKKNRNNDSKLNEKIIKDISDLDGDVIHFVNRLWFSEVTPQEQGIEMYELGHKVMNLKAHLRDLKSEIQELYDYARLQVEQKDNELIKTLTLLGTIFLPLTLVTGIWGMNIFPQDGPYIYLGLLTIVSLFLISILTVDLSRNKTFIIWKLLLKMIVSLFVLGLIFALIAAFLSNHLHTITNQIEKIGIF